LNATYFVFSQVFKVGAIAIVIIFQPEIRDALEKIGSGSLTGILNFSDQKKKRQLYSVAIENICVAIADLAGTADILPEHISEAASYRFLDKQNIFE
jgi:diadenylate cyclase